VVGLGCKTAAGFTASGSARGRADFRKNARQLAALARRIIAVQSDPRCRAYAVNRPAIRQHLDLFIALAERLESPKPVCVQGAARAARLLNDGGGPLYDPRRAGELGPTLAHALRELDVRQ